MATPNKCLLCKADNSKQSVATAHVYGDKTNSKAFFHCSVCDVFYQYPPLSRSEEKLFYEQEFEAFMASRSGENGGWLNAQNHIDANEDTKTRRLEYLNRYLHTADDILEFGCSSGFMLEHFKELGKNCFGIEPSGVFYDFLKNKFNVFRDIETLKTNHPTQKYDLILHFFVLEHVSDPINFLKEQINMLKPGGRVIFEIPNVADPLYSVFDVPSFERFYWSVAHPWYFSEKSLEFVLSAVPAKFRVLLDQRYDLSNHITWALTGQPGGNGKYTKMLGEELEKNYKEGLKKVRKCDTLIAILEME